MPFHCQLPSHKSYSKFSTFHTFPVDCRVDYSPRGPWSGSYLRCQGVGSLTHWLMLIPETWKCTWLTQLNITLMVAFANSFIGYTFWKLNSAIINVQNICTLQGGKTDAVMAARNHFIACRNIAGPLLDTAVLQPHWEKSGAKTAPLWSCLGKWCPFGRGAVSSTRGAELRTNKQLSKGSYFGSLFFLSADILSNSLWTLH